MVMRTRGAQVVIRTRGAGMLTAIDFRLCPDFGVKVRATCDG
jgi:hypothetical protein